MQMHTTHMLAPCLLPPSHALAYQVDLLQALESAQVHAQPLNVVVLHLLQQVVLVSCGAGGGDRGMSMTRVRNAMQGSRHKNRHATHPFGTQIKFHALLIVEEFARNSKTLVHPVALDETLSDLPHHLLADAGVALLRARQNQQAQHQLSSTHQVNRRHAAVALQPLSNHATRHIRQILVVALYHAPSRYPVLFKSTLHTRTPQTMPYCHTPLQAPPYQVDLFQELESAQVHAQPLYLKCQVVVSDPLRRVVLGSCGAGGGMSTISTISCTRHAT